MPNRASPRPDLFLLAVLAAAFAVRLLLIAGGVQDTPDDVRYLRALYMLQERDFSPLLGYTDHGGYTLLSIVPASLQRILSGATGTPLNDLYAVPAVFFACFSTANVALLYALVCRLGGSVREARITAVLAACSASLFYWVNYTLPYDISLFLALLGLLACLPGPGARRRMGGFLLAFAFLTYNAHWLLIGICGLLALLASPDRRAAAVRMAAGAAAPFLALVALTGGSYLRGMVSFSETVTQGAFSEGGRLIAEWAIAIEGVTLLVWAIGAGLAVVWLVSQRHTAPEASALARLASGDRRRVWLWLAGLVLVAAGLIVGSVVLERFVVYGRTARQLVPFAVLLAAWGWARLSPRTTPVLMLAAVLAAAPAYASLYGFASPRAVEAALCAVGIRFSRVVTVNRVRTPNDGVARIVLVNTRGLFPAVAYVPPPAGRVLARWRHPAAHPAQHYEGYTPAERALLRAHPPDILLIDTGLERAGSPAACP